jgi:hypothetical protein
MSDKEEKETDKVNEPGAVYPSREIRVFKSFEEQEAYEMKKMAELSSLEILQQLRKFINIAYGMHGYDPNNLPKEHSIRIVEGSRLIK